MQKRQAEILSAVKQNGACSIIELASKLSVSDETIRRNIKSMVADGVLEKVHGGVMLAKDQLAEPPFKRRMNKNVEQKKAISAMTAGIIKDGDSIMLDTGSTTSYVARALFEHSNLSVVTNCTEIGRILVNEPSNRVHICGGALRSDDWATFGVSAINYVGQFSVSYAILSIAAVTPDGEFLDYHIEESEFSRAVIRQAKKVIVVVDHTKFGKQNFVKVCDPDLVDLVVTDKTPPVEIANIFHEAGVEVITPNL